MEDVKVVAGLDKGMLRDKVFELDQVVGSIRLNAATIENVDIELGKISLDIEETNPDLQSMALMFNEIRHQVQLISNLMNYVTKDLQTNTEHLGELQGALWQEVKDYEDD